jgi:hypothetical protein
MTIPPPSRFVYRSNAIPISGRVLKIGNDPVSQNLQSPPASSLSVVGGFCQAISPGSVFRDIFSWGQCVAQSQGELSGDSKTQVTTLTSSILNVRAVNRPHIFTSGQLKLTLSSTHPTTGQPSITPREAIFGGDAGMALNKTKITVTDDLEDFRRMETLERFESEFQTNEAMYKKYRDRFLTREGKAVAFKQPLPRVQGGYVVGSFVNSIKFGLKKIPGNVLRFDGFGSIHFGEVIMNEYSRRFTLVRLEMGSDVQANVAFAEGEANGSWIP